MPVFDSLDRQRREFIIGNPVYDEAFISWVDVPLVPQKQEKRGPSWLPGTEPRCLRATGSVIRAPSNGTTRCGPSSSPRSAPCGSAKASSSGSPPRATSSATRTAAAGPRKNAAFTRCAYYWTWSVPNTAGVPRDYSLKLTWGDSLQPSSHGRRARACRVRLYKAGQGKRQPGAKEWVAEMQSTGDSSFSRSRETLNARQAPPPRLEFDHDDA